MIKSQFRQVGGMIVKELPNGELVPFLKYEPTLTQVHVNAPLTNISIAFMQDAKGFVADQVFPNIPVAKKSDVYFAYDRSYFFRNLMQQRAPGTESAGQGYSIDNTPQYNCTVFALHHDIPDAIRANADSPLNMDMDASNFLGLQAMINREVNWASAYFATGLWTFDLSGLSTSSYASSQFVKWSTANSTPIEDIRHFMTSVQGITGYRPNTLVMGRQVFDVLVDHAEFVDRTKYGQTGTDKQNPATVNQAIMSIILGLDRILVMDSIQTTSAEGQTSNTYAFIGGKAALLCYVPAAAGIMTPSAGYTFSWNGYTGAGPQGQRVSKFRMEWLKIDRVEIEQAYTQKLVSADLGAFFNNAVA